MTIVTSKEMWEKELIYSDEQFKQRIRKRNAKEIHRTCKRASKRKQILKKIVRKKQGSKNKKKERKKVSKKERKKERPKNSGYKRNREMTVAFIPYNLLLMHLLSHSEATSCSRSFFAEPDIWYKDTIILDY